MSPAREDALALGRRGTWLAVAAVAAGCVAFATGLGGGGAPRTFGALIANWLFFTGTAVGAVAFRAFFRIMPGRWSRPLLVHAGAHVRVAPVALALVALLVAGGATAPWVANASGWLATPALAVRQLLLNALLFGLAWRWFRRPPGEGPAPSLSAGVAFSIVFALVLSCWAFDFVLATDPVFGSTIIGPYLFVGAFVAGTGLLTLRALAGGELDDAARRDVTSLVFALSIVWVYLFASQFLTIWYGNLPDETAFTLRRMAGGWGAIGLAVLLLVFAIPFLGLLHPAGRASPRVLGAALAGQLLGLWLNCQLLVVPSFPAADGPPIDLRNVLIALGVLGAYALAVAGARQGALPLPARGPT